MDFAKIKIWTIAGVAGVVVAYAGYWYGAQRHTPDLAAIATSGCNVPQALAGLEMPMDLLRASTAGVAFAVGPMEAGALPAPLQLVFDPSVDGNQREVAMTGGTLALPVGFGRTATTPDRITLTCRDGAVTTVRYASGRSAATTFNVVRVEPVPVPPLAESEEGPTGG